MLHPEREQGESQDKPNNVFETSNVSDVEENESQRHPYQHQKEVGQHCCDENYLVDHLTHLNGQTSFFSFIFHHCDASV